MTIRLQPISIIPSMFHAGTVGAILRLVHHVLTSDERTLAERVLAAQAAAEMVERGNPPPLAWYLVGRAHGHGLLQRDRSVAPLTQAALEAHLRGVLEALERDGSFEAAKAIVHADPATARAALGAGVESWERRLLAVIDGA